MIKQLTLEGFRGFQRFAVGELGRINLLVGTNNCGKTSILEAVQILGSSGDPSSLWQVASRRGERFHSDSKRVVSSEADVCHLFHGHEIDSGSMFKILAQTEAASQALTVTIGESSRQRSLFEESETGPDEDDVGQEPNLALECDWSAVPSDAARLPLSMRGGVSTEAMRRHTRLQANGSSSVRYISTAGLMVHDIVTMFEDIVLTREEELVIQALSTIEPTIERIATVSGDRRRSYPGERGGIVIKSRDSTQRIPIGSMGDGMWRMLGLALALVSAENGILLVDEIDTGLHFTVLERMWKLIDQASSRLNVQVFATTHSRDAYESLAAISRESVTAGSEVTIQRIDRFKSKSVAFTEQEIIASSERGTEVR